VSLICLRTLDLLPAAGGFGGVFPHGLWILCLCSERTSAAASHPCPILCISLRSGGQLHSSRHMHSICTSRFLSPYDNAHQYRCFHFISKCSSTSVISTQSSGPLSKSPPEVDARRFRRGSLELCFVRSSRLEIIWNLTHGSDSQTRTPPHQCFRCPPGDARYSNIALISILRYHRSVANLDPLRMLTVDPAPRDSSTWIPRPSGLPRAHDGYQGRNPGIAQLETTITVLDFELVVAPVVIQQLPKQRQA
jgi:hypothetical protein